MYRSGSGGAGGASSHGISRDEHVPAIGIGLRVDVDRHERRSPAMPPLRDTITSMPAMLPRTLGGAAATSVPRSGRLAGGMRG